MFSDDVMALTSGLQAIGNPIQAAEAVQEGAAPADAIEDAAATDQETAATQDDPEAIEGSGGGVEPPSGFFSFPSFPSFFTRGIFGGGSRSARQYIDGIEEHGNYNAYDDDQPTYSASRQSRQFFSECTDRITLPCIVEDFIGAGMGNVPSCLPIHCGDTLCDYGVIPCKIESTVKPFGLGIHFGEGEEKGSPEDNIGACLKYNQMSCT